MEKYIPDRGKVYKTDKDGKIELHSDVIDYIKRATERKIKITYNHYVKNK